MTLFGKLAIGLNNINSFKLTVAYKTIDDAFRNLQFLGNIFYSKPVRSRQFFGPFEHIKKTVHIIEQVLADRAGFTVSLRLGMHVVCTFSDHTYFNFYLLNTATKRNLTNVSANIPITNTALLERVFWVKW